MEPPTSTASAARTRPGTVIKMARRTVFFAPMRLLIHPAVGRPTRAPTEIESSSTLS